MVQLTGGAEITASTFGPGRGGNVVIDATRVELSDGSSMLASSVSENPDAGISGSIVITTKDRLTLDRQSKLTVETERANAGEIIVQAKQLVLLDRQSEISTSVAGGEGDGGNIRIDPVFVVLNDGSGIIANAQRGMGGNIDIRITEGGAFLQSPDSIVDASSEFGLDGRVDIVAPDTDISGGISTLPASFLNAANLLADRCAARNTEEVSSFVVLGEDRVPLAPRYSSLSAYAVGAKRRAGLVLEPNTGSRNYRLDYAVHCRQHHAP
jgi:large exoprotein involved in heme utilization and adhesion